jgi:uncharacterized repeat protein (TIGR01451 family)
MYGRTRTRQGDDTGGDCPRGSVSKGSRRRRLVGLVCGLVLSTGLGLVLAPTALAANPEPVQYYYVPFPETDLLSAFSSINAAAVTPITSYIGITAIAAGTLIYYDQRENGYDIDIANPANLYSNPGNLGGTQIWGDGITANGTCPGTANDLITAGMLIILNNTVPLPRVDTNILYDGGDKIASSKTIALTRTSWAAGSNTLLSGSVEVYDLYNWGTDYRAPVGTNIPDGTDFQMFEYTALSIMAGPDGASVQIDAAGDGTFESTIALAEGASTFVTGVYAGGHVLSDNPVQVDIFTGDIGSNYESRDSALIPTGTWSSDYVTPVSTVSTVTQGATTYSGTDTTVWLFNSSASSITVTYRRWLAGTVQTVPITVTAGSYAKQLLTDGTGAEFLTAGGQPFYAFSTTDSNNGTSNNQGWDWGFSLVPKGRLSTQVLVGLGIGRDPTSGTNPRENGNPVWITPMVGNTVTPATVYVDYDGDPSTGGYTDPNGRRYDVSYSLRELERAKVYTSVVADASSSSATNPGGTSATLAWSHTTGATANLMVVGVSIANDSGTTATVNSVTYGSQNLQRIGVGNNVASGTVRPRTEIWALANPTPGAPNVTVTLSAARAFVAGATTFSGANVSSGVAAAFGAPAYGTSTGSSPSTVNVFTVAGDMTYEVTAVAQNGGTDPGALTAGTGQTQRWTQLTRSGGNNTNIRRIRGAASTMTAIAASTTMTEAQTGTAYPWAITGVAIKPISYANSQSGLLIYTLNSAYKLAAAWGQDPLTAMYGAPGLDVGTSVPPMPEISAGKDVSMYTDNDGDGYLSPADVLEYSIKVYNVSRIPVPDVRVYDVVPPGTTYVLSSTYNGVTPIPDDGSGTPFPLDNGTGMTAGVNIGTLAYGASSTVTFRATINAYAGLGGATRVDNAGSGSALNVLIPVKERSYLRGHISDYVWFDANENGIQNVGEGGVAGVTVRLLNGTGTAPVLDDSNQPITAVTDSSGLYDFKGLYAGSYTVEFVAPDGTVFTSKDVGQVTVDVANDSDADQGDGQTDTIVLGGGQKIPDADAGLVLKKPTLAVISSFSAYALGDEVVVNWSTASETNTAGYNLERLDPVTNQWMTVNENLVPALFESPNGGTYSVVDPAGKVKRDLTYRLVEVEASGSTLVHGPYQVKAAKALPGGQARDEIARGRLMARVAKSPSTAAALSAAKPSGGLRVASAMADRLRIEVTGSGLYKVEVADLVTGLRLTETKARELIGTGGLQLTSQGEAVAYLAVADASAIYFYGQAIDSVYTASSVYWLRVAPGTSMQLASLQTAATTTSTAGTTTSSLATTTTAAATTTTEALPPETVTAEGTSTIEPTSTTEPSTGSPSGGLALSTEDSESSETTLPVSTTVVETPASAATTFIDSIHAEQDLIDVPTLFHDPQSDIWLWDYLVAGYAPLASKTVTVAVPDAVSGRSLTAQLQGLVTAEKDNEHHVQVKLNGTTLGETWWTGAVAHSATFDIPDGVLHAGDNQVQIVALLDSGIDYSLVALDSLDVTYERSLTASADQLQLDLLEAGLARVSGLSSTNAWVFDLADPLVPRAVQATSSGGEAGNAWLEFEAQAASEYLVATASGSLRPRAITAVAASTLRAAGKGADYVVITSPSLAGAAGRLAAYRAKDGLRALVVTTTEIYDEFNNGIASPLAIKDFIGYASTKWKPVARFVVLAGEGSYDYRNYSGSGDSLVPCLLVDSADGLVVSDVVLGDNQGGDGAPEVAIGRIPALTETELDAALAKIKAYEAAKVTGQRTTLLAADNPDDSGNFAADSNSLASLIPRTVRVSKAYLSGSNLTAVRSALLSSFSNGTLLVDYMGHASVGQLAEESMLTVADVPTLRANSLLPVVTAYTCVVGQYGLPGYDSLSEALAMRAKAGAIAVWAPSALEENEYSVQLARLFAKNMFAGSRTVRLGSAIQATLKAGAKQGLPVGMLTTYNLLGDPALKVRW